MTAKKNENETPASQAKKKADAVVFRLKDRSGREYRTSDEAEAMNRVRTQGYELLN
jgi:hypothetical protein